jgi:hypothetical protein
LTRRVPGLQKKEESVAALLQRTEPVPPAMFREGDLMMTSMRRWLVAAIAAALAGCAAAPAPDPASTAPAIEHYDLLIRNGVVYDGTGAEPRRVDIAVRGDRIAALLPGGSPAEATRAVTPSRRVSSTCSPGRPSR